MWNKSIWNQSRENFPFSNMFFPSCDFLLDWYIFWWNTKNMYVNIIFFSSTLPCREPPNEGEWMYAPKIYKSTIEYYVATFFCRHSSISIPISYNMIYWLYSKHKRGIHGSHVIVSCRTNEWNGWTRLDIIIMNWVVGKKVKRVEGPQFWWWWVKGKKIT